uniref:Cathepsin L10 n=1 Tax=Dysdercus peruvianus TaxID=685034 RepID=A0A7U3NJG1_9HEMI|nr:cathepsin L10 [Dysdercus peruvianus]
MKFFLILFALVGFSQAVSFFNLGEEEFNMFKISTNRQYKTETEERYRKKIFLENKKKVNKHNSMFQRGLVSFTLKLNHMADLLSHEFAKTYNGFNKSTRATNNRRMMGSTFIAPEHVTLPESVDWRQQGLVTPVKNQGRCGSCWAFSSTGALEGQHYRKTKQLISLSEQNLMDCSQEYGNNGCEGGLMDQAFEYVKDNHGIDTEKSYPYEGLDNRCRFKRRSIGAVDTGFVDIAEGDEEALKKAVATVGPISIAIDASQQSFQFYNQGVYYEPLCSSEQLDHGVLLVGYGTDDDGQDYWLVKNSWGTGWGEKGYIRMARNRDNNCGIATSASYPLV